MTNANLIYRDLRLMDMLDGDLGDAERGLETSIVNPALNNLETMLVAVALDKVKLARVSIKERRNTSHK